MEKRWAAVPMIFAAVAGAAEIPATQPAIDWQPQTMRFATEGTYARMARIDGKTLLLVYENEGVAYARRSQDEGRTWSEPTTVAANAEGVCTNAQPLVLADGRILYFYNFRPHREGLAYRIELCTSDDGGRTWKQRPEAIYLAGTKFGDGCWEPAAVELPSGEIQLFFANEGPYRNSDEQEITLMRSSDGGMTWGPPQAVSFRPMKRDGMPVPLVLADGKNIVFAIEDNGLSGDAFKPVIIRSPLQNSWQDGPMGARNKDRWGALAEPLPAGVYAGAPYLVQMPDGRTILSCQSDEDSKNPIMTVYLGNAEARHFAGKSHPFSPALVRRGMWNSLFVLNRNRITAVSSTAINDRRGIWLIDGIVP